MRCGIEYFCYIRFFKTCKIENVVIHLFQISLDWNVIPGFGIQFSDGRYHSRKDSQRNSWYTLGRITSTAHATTYHRISKKQCKRVWKCLELSSCRCLFGWQTYSYSLSYWLWCNVLLLQKVLSVVLQGLVEANYKFITVDMGDFGKQSDGGTFLASDLFSFIDGKSIIFPEPDFLPRSNVTAPYVMLGDEAYPLLSYLMKPYERNSLTDRRRNFNERLSRAKKKRWNVLLEFCILNGVLFRKQ